MPPQEFRVSWQRHGRRQFTGKILRGHNMKILVVDDQGLIREGIALQIKLLDPSYIVDSCGDIAEARTHLASGSAPEIIFLDVSMDGNHTAGLDFLDELKDADCPSRIIILSAQDDAATVGRAIGSGAVGFITKNGPDASPMRRAIEMVVQGGVFISDELRRRRPPTTLFRPPQTPAAIRVVGPDELKITAPRIYEVLWHISNGVKGYKNIANKMGIADSTVEGFARDGFSHLNVRGKEGFLVMLTQKGWKLAPPAGHAARRSSAP
jgi:DNA-binding NarL/FixJ family response regulator